MTTTWQGTGTAAISEEFPAAFYDKRLLMRLMPKLVHVQFGVKRSLPKNSGKVINFRQFSNLAAATTPLTEATTPDSTQIAVAELTATIAQYGAFTAFSDLVTLTAIDPLLTEAADELGDQAGDSLDQITRDVIVAGTTVQRPNDRASQVDLLTTDLLTISEVRRAVRTLKAANVPTIDGDYVAIIHPHSVHDLQSDSAWINAQQYAQTKAIFTGEVGKMYGVRFIESSNAKVYANAGASLQDIYGTLIFGKGFYGVIELEGEGNVQFIYKALGSAGADDPLNQRQTTGWKVNGFVAKILNNTCAVRIEHSTTASTS